METKVKYQAPILPEDSPLSPGMQSALIELGAMLVQLGQLQFKAQQARTFGNALLHIVCIQDVTEIHKIARDAFREAGEAPIKPA